MMSRSMVASDFERIPMHNYPFLVVTDTLANKGGFWSYFSYVAKRHTRGRYGHSMWMIRCNKFQTQNSRFMEVPLEDYVDDHHRVKLWYNPDWSEAQREAIHIDIEEKLKKRGRYDWLGIIGSRLNIRRINFSKRNFCSEATAETLFKAEPTARLELPAHPTPTDINQWCKMAPQMVCYGVYDPEHEEY